MLNGHVLLGYRSNGPKGIQKTGRLNSTFWFVILAIIFLYPLILQYRKYTRIDANVANHLVNSKGFNWKLILCLLYQIFHYKAGKTIELEKQQLLMAMLKKKYSIRLIHGNTDQ